MSVETDRPTLGPFMNLVCFQYLRSGTEEVADRAPIVASGRQRGYDLVEGLGLLGSTKDPEIIRQKLDEALGINGTRLCIVNSVTVAGDDVYQVRVSENATTAGQTSSVPLCSFTLGAFIGALHAITGMRMRGRELECSACGAKECLYQIEPV